MSASESEPFVAHSGDPTKSRHRRKQQLFTNHRCNVIILIICAIILILISPLQSFFPEDEDFPVSTIRCVGECCGFENKRTCFYENLYYFNDKFYLYSPSTLEIPMVLWGERNWTLLYGWVKAGENRFQPIHITNTSIFQNRTRVVKHELYAFYDIFTIWNWVHTVFDSVYPVFAALERFGKENEIFCTFTRSVVFNTGWFHSEPLTENLPSEFGMCPKSEQFIDRAPGNTVIRFKQAISGIGDLGDITMYKNRNYMIHGGRELMRKFRARMMRAYNVREVNSPKKIIFPTNKREIGNITLFAQELQTILDVKYPNLDLKAEVVDFGKFKSFGEQLELLQNVAINIGGVGSSNYYPVFMREKSVVINLGRSQVEHNVLHTGYREDAFNAAATNVKQLFYPWETRRCGVKWEELLPLIEEAIGIISNPWKHFPMKESDYWSPFAGVVRDYYQSEEGEELWTWVKNNSFALKPAFVILNITEYEKHRLPINHTKMEAIKTKHGLPLDIVAHQIHTVDDCNKKYSTG